MPTARKRSAQELDSNSAQQPEQPEQPSMLQRLRNMWQFANLYQFILLFGSALKLDDNMDIEVGSSRFAIVIPSIVARANHGTVIHSRTWRPNVSSQVP